MSALKTGHDDALAALLRALIADGVRDSLNEMKRELVGAVREELASHRAPEAAADLLSVGEVARRLSIRPGTVREWIRTGYLSAVSIGPAGRRYGVRPEELERLLEKHPAVKKPMDNDALAIHIVRTARTRSRERKE